MIFSKNKYSCGIILSLSATTISLIGTFIVYRMLWTGVAITQFAFWFSFLELSQLFLLADVGFTQDFIRNAVRQNADFNRELATVRGKLFGIGSLSVGVLVILFYIKNDPSYIPNAELWFIAISVFVTLLSYAETAALRVKEKFFHVYVINIFSSFSFLLIVIFLRKDPLFAIAFATLIRSCLQFGLQIVAVGQRFAVNFDSYPVPSVRVLAFNAPYMFLFLPDGILLLEMGGGAGVIASLLLIKKYYDTLRGFVDAALQVGSIQIAKEYSYGVPKSYYWGIGIFHLIATLAFPVLVEIWVGSFKINWFAICSLAFSSFSIACFRVVSTHSFYSNNAKIFSLLGVAIVAKLFFVVALLINPSIFGIAYISQGFVLIVSILFFEFILTKGH